MRKWTRGHVAVRRKAQRRRFESGLPRQPVGAITIPLIGWGPCCVKDHRCESAALRRDEDALLLWPGQKQREGTRAPHTIRKRSAMASHMDGVLRARNREMQTPYDGPERRARRCGPGNGAQWQCGSEQRMTPRTDGDACHGSSTAEQLICNQPVVSSNLICGSNAPRTLLR